VFAFDILKGNSLCWADGLKDNIKLVNDRRKRVLGNQSPFEVFFGRSKHGGSFLTPNEIQQKARQATCVYTKRMMKAQEKTLKTPVYDIYDKVLVRVPFKKSRVTSKQKCRKAIVNERALDFYKYKLLYKDDAGHHKRSWFSMKDITSYTQNKQQESQIASELTKPLDHNDRINNLETEV
jgi:hypothetical protein